MSHGTPDWRRTAGTVTTYQLTDMGELAARLDSPVLFDRRGDTFWYDGFEATLLKWRNTGAGGSTAARSVASAWRGEASAILTTNNAPGGNARLQRRTYQPPFSRFGIALMLSTPDLLAETFGVYIYAYDGTQYHLAVLRVRINDNAIDILKSDLSFVEVLAHNLEHTDFHYHALKFVIDLDSDEYVRLIVDNQLVDISSYSMSTGASALGPFFFVDIMNHVGDGGGARTVYVDDVILTQNEP